VQTLLEVGGIGKNRLSNYKDSAGALVGGVLGADELLSVVLEQGFGPHTACSQCACTHTLTCCIQSHTCCIQSMRMHTHSRAAYNHTRAAYNQCACTHTRAAYNHTHAAYNQCACTHTHVLHTITHVLHTINAHAHTHTHVLHTITAYSIHCVQSHTCCIQSMHMHTHTHAHTHTHTHTQHTHSHSHTQEVVLSHLTGRELAAAAWTCRDFAWRVRSNRHSARTLTIPAGGCGSGGLVRMG